MSLLAQLLQLLSENTWQPLALLATCSMLASVKRSALPLLLMQLRMPTMEETNVVPRIKITISRVRELTRVPLLTQPNSLPQLKLMLWDVMPTTIYYLELALLVLLISSLQLIQQQQMLAKLKIKPLLEPFMMKQRNHSSDVLLHALLVQELSINALLALLTSQILKNPLQEMLTMKLFLRPINSTMQLLLVYLHALKDSSFRMLRPELNVLNQLPLAYFAAPAPPAPGIMPAAAVVALVAAALLLL